jgi:hypothetical protein
LSLCYSKNQKLHPLGWSKLLTFNSLTHKNKGCNKPHPLGCGAHCFSDYMGEKLDVKLRDAKDVEEIDLPKSGLVTNETKSQIIEYAQTHYVGNVRWAIGRIWTTEAYEARRKRVLETPLP